LVVYPWTKM
uniref:Opioid peptide n=1 Tax=Amblyomma testudinarium TaxID=375577 RepID=OPIP1_AMBTS|nr:RecName: Full=Opioid peptide [Amblyomma testudinarium]